MHWIYKRDNMIAIKKVQCPKSALRGDLEVLSKKINFTMSYISI